MMNRRLSFKWSSKSLKPLQQCSPNPHTHHWHKVQICCNFLEIQNDFGTNDRGMEKDLQQSDGNRVEGIGLKPPKLIPTVFIHNIDGYEFSYLLMELNRSSVYRNMLLQKYSSCFTKDSTLSVIVLLKPAQKGVFDPTGNSISMSYIVEKCELDVALSWLSTLGGAFSALGDNSISYAAEAGRVSITQLKIAFKLKDPLIASRCRLYAAISLLQRGYLKSAKDIVKREYRYALSLPENQDPRLIRMCFGIWAKLQYYWALDLMKKRGINSFEEVLQKSSEVRKKKKAKLLSGETEIKNSTSASL